MSSNSMRQLCMGLSRRCQSTLRKSMQGLRLSRYRRNGHLSPTYSDEPSLIRCCKYSSSPTDSPRAKYTGNGAATNSRDGCSISTRSSEGGSPKPLVDLIIHHTQATREHLTPEIELRLITRECALWHENTDQCPFTDPFWAFYWPGGQALTRYILDNPEMIKDKTVLDVGSGCGASAIAAHMAGASKVLANDIDPVAVDAININAALNRLTLDTSTENLLCKPLTENNNWDLIFLGDMFYDRDFTNTVCDWLIGLIRTHRSRVLIGDPGRVYLKDHPMRKNLIKLFEIQLLSNCVEENRGHSTGYVWEFVLF